MSVPNTNSFSLQDVRDELGLGATTSLTACFAAADDGLFDINYVGSKNGLLNFRNYGLDPLSVYILNIKTRSWNIGALLPAEKYNLIELIYITGEDYVSKIENITRGVLYQSDNSNFYTPAAANTNFYNTSRPLKATLMGTHYATSVSATGLYFKVLPNTYFKSLNPAITRQSGGWYKMLFNLVASESVTLSLDQSSLYFDNAGNPLTTYMINVTASGDWYVICPSWLTLDKYYGTGNDTIYIISIDSPGFPGDISVYKMTNAAPKVCHILYPVVLDNTLLQFHHDGSEYTTNEITVTSYGTWTRSLINTGDGTSWVTALPSTGGTGATCTLTLATNTTGYSRACYIRFTVAGCTTDCTITQDA